jgi:hypothetical protein
MQPIGLQCTNRTYQGVVSTDCPVAISSISDFVDLPILSQLGDVEFLFLKTNAALTLRLNGVAATLTGSGGTFPTLFAGGETLIVEVDGGAAVTTTFDAADQSAAQVAARINAAFALQGQALPASVSAGGQVVLTGVLTGVEGTVEVTGGTGQATLGFTANTNDSAVGVGQDVTINGLWMAEFGSSNAADRIQVRGVASQVMIMAAGSAP